MTLNLLASLPVSLVITPADGSTLDAVYADAQSAADGLGCTVVFTWQGRLKVVRASEKAGGGCEVDGGLTVTPSQDAQNDS